MDASPLNPYPKSIGSFIRASYLAISSFILPKILSNNPRARILCNFEFDYEKTKKLLAHAYEKYKSLDICAVSNVENVEKNTVSFCIYNPFKDNGVLICKNITEDTIEKYGREIVKYMDDRVRDLQGYPLKVKVSKLFIYFKISLLKFLHFKALHF